jgi:UDP-N-acetylmuramoyl-tripeptide--D-alanyl-D-alanine ligase
MTIEALYEIYKQHPSVQTDTRKLKKGDIFFALKGGNFNGNSFAASALEAGASYAVIDEKEFETAGKTILVPDVLTSLQQLAKYHREQFNLLPHGRQVPFIAITGSNGKTTTKELVHAVLSSTFKTDTTEGNLNNHIGVPLTILKIRPDAEAAVIEMGANHLKEIEGYCTYAQPTHGLITNIGKAHLEGFGGPEGVKKGKGELFDYLRAHQGAAFVFWDDDYLRKISDGIPTVIKYGIHDAETTGRLVKTEPFLEVAINGFKSTAIKTNLVGDYNLPNILAAIAIGTFFGVREEKIKYALENYIPSNSRSQLIEKGTNKIILDAYNANPSSMKLAIENFARFRADHKVLLLGAMAELGKESLREHQLIVDLLKTYTWRQVVLVGGDFMKIEHPFLKFSSSDEAKTWLQQQQFENTSLLIKGSRSMQMEKVLEN